MGDPVRQFVDTFLVFGPVHNTGSMAKNTLDGSWFPSYDVPKRAVLTEAKHPLYIWYDMNYLGMEFWTRYLKMRHPQGSSQICPFLWRHPLLCQCH